VKWLAIAIIALIAGWLGLAPTIELHRALQPTNEPNPLHPTIVMLGDSHTAFVNWRMMLHCPNIANDGVGGNTTAQILARLPEVLAQGPRLVILMAGTNDALQHIDASETSKNIQSIKAALSKNSIELETISPPLSGNPATIPVHFDGADLLPDGVHLRRSGYAKWRDAVTPLVRRYCYQTTSGSPTAMK
jgi:lysophospholipase L1-like esterase